MCTKVVACEVPWGSEAQKPIHLIFPPIDLCKLSSGEKMPKVKRSRKAPPDGWELIEPTLDELDQKMREGKWGSSCLDGLCPRATGFDACGARHKPRYKWEETGCTTVAS